MAPGVAGWCHLALPDGPWRCRIAGRCRPAWAVPAVCWYRPAASPHVTWRCRVVLALPVGAVPVRRPLKFSNRGSVRSAQALHSVLQSCVLRSVSLCNLRDVSIVVTNRVGQGCKFRKSSQPQIGSWRSEPFQLRAGRFMRSCMPCASFPTSPARFVVGVLCGEQGGSVGGLLGGSLARPLVLVADEARHVQGSA